MHAYVTYTHTYEDIHTYIYICIYVYMYVCIYTYAHVGMHVRHDRSQIAFKLVVYKYIQTYTQTYVCPPSIAPWCVDVDRQIVWKNRRTRLKSTFVTKGRLDMMFMHMHIHTRDDHASTHCACSVMVKCNYMRAISSLLHAQTKAASRPFQLSTKTDRHRDSRLDRVHRRSPQRIVFGANSRLPGMPFLACAIGYGASFPVSASHPDVPASLVKFTPALSLSHSLASLLLSSTRPWALHESSQKRYH